MNFEISQLSQYFSLVILLILPGFAFLLIFKNKIIDFWQSGIVFLAPVMSIAIFSFPLYIAYLAKANLVLLGYALLAILFLSGFFIIFTLQKNKSLRLPAEKDTVYNILLFCLFIGITYVTSDAMRINTTFSADSLFHLSRINKIITHATAGNFNPLTGNVIEIGKEYANNFYHLLIAVLTVLTGLKAVSIWYFLEYMNLLLLLTLTYSFSKLFFSRQTAFILIGLVFGTTFFLLNYRPDGDSAGVWAHATLYPFHFLFLNYPNAYVNKILSLSILFLFFLYRGGKLKYHHFLILTCIIFFSAAGIHFTGAILAFAGLSILVFASLLLRESSMRWRNAIILMALVLASFLLYFLSVALRGNAAPVHVDPSQLNYQVNVGGQMLVLGKDLYIVDPKIYLNVFSITGIIAPIALFFLTRKKAWLLFGVYMIGKYVLILFNPFAHLTAFMILGQHAKLRHFIDQDFVEKFLVASLVVAIGEHILRAIPHSQVIRNSKLAITAFVLIFLALLTSFSITKKTNADKILQYSPYNLSFQEIINQYLYLKNVTVLSDVTTSRYITALLGNNIVGTTKQFNASTTEENLERQLATEALMGTIPFDNFLSLIRKHKVNYIYINNEIGIDNFFVTNRLEKMSTAIYNSRIIHPVIQDKQKTLYATLWDLLDEHTPLFFQQTAQAEIDRELNGSRVDIKKLLELLKLADAFSLKNEKIVSRIMSDYHINISSKNSPTDTIAVEMELLQYFRAEKQTMNELAVYSDMLDIYSGYDTYPDRVYQFIHDVVGFPQQIPALDLRDRYGITNRKVKNNRELTNYLVNTYIQSGLYERALEIGNQYRLIDQNYEYLNDRLREASDRLGQQKKR